jgi:hypothetical protein
MHKLLHRSTALAFQVQDTSGIPSKRNGIFDKEDIECDKEKEETDTQWAENTISTLCTFNQQASRGWKGALTSNPSTGKTKPLPQQAQVQNSDHWPQKGSVYVLCKTNQDKI